MLFVTQFMYLWVKEDSQWENNRMGLDCIHKEQIRLWKIGFLTNIAIFSNCVQGIIVQNQ